MTAELRIIGYYCVAVLAIAACMVAPVAAATWWAGA